VKKTILITGAATGIGRASAIALATLGHHVYATAEKEQQAAEVNEYGLSNNIKLESFKLDITSEEDCLKIADLEIDVLLNNAGVGYSGSLAEIDIDLIRKNFEVNVYGSIRLTQVALKGMIERSKGTIMFVSSVAGRLSFPFLAPYCMSKHALEAAAESLKAEMDALGKGIQVCLIEPGPYHTGFNQQIMGNKFSWMGKESVFADHIEILKSKDEDSMKQLETTDLNSIVEKIVLAAEADKPDMRYFAPEWLLEMVKEQEAAR
jgi:short-subunit dehydrogenase